MNGDDLPVNIDDTIEIDNTIEIRTQSETHIGTEKKSGGWLENETDKILKFAGFDTQREYREVFEESTNDHYRVDILAKYDDLTLFVECKDYTETKINEKILFTLIGQVNDYRRSHSDEVVVGILVTSAKNIGQNEGIQTKLLRSGCVLWDGIMIQALQDRMLQVERRSEFITYLFDLVGYTSNTISGKKTRLEPGQHKIYCRISFFTIPKLKYIGNKFSDTAIHHDLSHILSTSGIIISSLKHKTINTPEGERMKLIIDFEKVFTLQKLNDHWDKQKGWFSKPKENPLELMEIDFNTACQTAISQTYGVENKLQISYPIYSIATRSE